jgi:hypothetical protein
MERESIRQGQIIRLGVPPLSDRETCNPQVTPRVAAPTRVGLYQGSGAEEKVVLESPCCSRLKAFVLKGIDMYWVYSWCLD